MPGERRRVAAFCPLCVSRCGCQAVVENGRLVAIEPDPSHPTGKALCAKGRASPELVEATDRLLYPMRRTRPKGDPDPGWRRITWDEALDETATAMRRIAAESGPETVAFAVTTPSGTAISDAAPWVDRLINAFGSPNNCNATELCAWHRNYARVFTTGTAIGTPDYERAGCILLWGHNPSTSLLAAATRVADCGGATALLGRLITKGTEEPLLAYCRRVLCDPMGFGPADWARGRDGEFRAASGLRLLPRDLLKIGQLVLAGGVWNGHQIVPGDWLKRALTPAVTIADGRRYGYHWYLGASPGGPSQRWERWVGEIGWGGQRLYVFPALDLVVAQYCGNYDKPGTEQRRINDAIITEIVLPGFV